MKYDWSKERIEAVIRDCDSLTQVLNKLNIPRAGNNSATLRKKLEEYNIDYSHFTYGVKDKKGTENYIPAKTYLGTGKHIQTSKLKEKLFKEGLKKNECENLDCPCKGYWLGSPLVCQLHHINGNNTDNRLENLQILCPNCHSQTDNYCGQANKTPKYFCELCGGEKKTKTARYCQKCAIKMSCKVEMPPKEELILKFKELRSFLSVGKYYGVTDNAIRNWCKKYDLPSTKKELIIFIEKKYQ